MVNRVSTLRDDIGFLALDAVLSAHLLDANRALVRVIVLLLLRHNKRERGDRERSHRVPPNATVADTSVAVRTRRV